MRTFHENWSFVVVVLNLLVGLWGLLWVRRHPPAPKLFWPAVIAGIAALGVQVTTGVLLIPTYGNPSPIHMFYGVVLTLAAVFAFAIRSQDPKHNITIFSAAVLFIGAVAVRAMITG